jgi:hypothetical protein
MAPVTPVAQDAPVVGLKPAVEVQPVGRAVEVAHDAPVVTLYPVVVVQPAGRVIVVVVVVDVDVLNELT